MTLDVLAIGTHPDDVELGVGGLVHKLVRQGYTVGIMDLSQGELATRGSVQERQEESQAAARILGVALRQNAGLPDGRIANTPEQQGVLVSLIRDLRPEIMLAPMDNDRHPDHGQAHALIRAANFYAGLAKFQAGGGEPHRASRMYYYRTHGENTEPHLVIDISDDFEAKIESIGAYRSQFHNPAYSGEQTYISTPEFWESIRTKAAYWGRRIGVAFGEPLHADLPVGLATLPGAKGKS